MPHSRMFVCACVRLLRIVRARGAKLSGPAPLTLPYMRTEARRATAARGVPREDMCEENKQAPMSHLNRCTIILLVLEQHRVLVVFACGDG